MDWKLAEGQFVRATLNGSLLNKLLITDIYCNDCEKECKSSFHFLGLECLYCKGFNTTRV